MKTGTNSSALAGSKNNTNYKPPKARQPGGKPGPQTMAKGGKISNKAIRAACG